MCTGTDKAVHAMQLSNERARTTLDLARAAEALRWHRQCDQPDQRAQHGDCQCFGRTGPVAREVDRNLVNIRDLSLQSSAGANQTSAASRSWRAWRST